MPRYSIYKPLYDFYRCSICDYEKNYSMGTSPNTACPICGSFDWQLISLPKTNLKLSDFQTITKGNSFLDGANKISPFAKYKSCLNDGWEGIKPVKYNTLEEAFANAGKLWSLQSIPQKKLTDFIGHAAGITHQPTCTWISILQKDTSVEPNKPCQWGIFFNPTVSDNDQISIQNLSEIPALANAKVMVICQIFNRATKAYSYELKSLFAGCTTGITLKLFEKGNYNGEFMSGDFKNSTIRLLPVIICDNPNEYYLIPGLKPSARIIIKDALNEFKLFIDWSSCRGKAYTDHNGYITHIDIIATACREDPVDIDPYQWIEFQGLYEANFLLYDEYGDSQPSIQGTFNASIILQPHETNTVTLYTIFISDYPGCELSKKGEFEIYQSGDLLASDLIEKY